MKVNGEIAIVTGGAGGLGKWYVTHLLQRKTKVNQDHGFFIYKFLRGFIIIE